MSYPVINHYQPILDLIEDKPVFVARRDENLGIITIGYKLLAPGSFTGETDEESALLRECRGIVFDIQTGKVLSRRFHKFGNLNDSDENQINNIDFSKDHWIMEKLDGSMVSFIKVKDKFYCMTKMGMTDFSSLPIHFMNKPNYIALLDETIKNDWTATFEYLSPFTQIVIPYTEEDLILTGIRDNRTGEYVLNPDQLKEFGQKFDVPVVKSWKSDLDIINKIPELQKQEDIEGFIIRFANGDMKKCKTDFYIQRHRFATGGSLNKRKDIVSAIVNETIDDIIPFIDNEQSLDSIAKFREAFVNGINDTVARLISIHDDFYVDNKKDFVQAIQSTNLTGKEKSLIISNYNKTENIEKAIIKSIQGATGSDPKLDKEAYLFGDIPFDSYNNFKNFDIKSIPTP